MKTVCNSIKLEVLQATCKETNSKRTGKKGVVCVLYYTLALPGICPDKNSGRMLDLGRALPNGNVYKVVAVAYPLHGDEYNYETGVKVARAKAEMMAYSQAQGTVRKTFAYIKKVMDDVTTTRTFTVDAPDGVKKNIISEGFYDKVKRVRDMNYKYLKQF